MGCQRKQFASLWPYLISIFCQPTILFFTLSHFIPNTKVPFLRSPLAGKPLQSKTDMTTAAAAFTPATLTGAVVSFGSKTKKRTNKVVYIGGLNSYGGLKAHNSVLSLGLPMCTEECFAKVVSSLKGASNAKGRGGGALSSKCGDAGEIFRIAAIMNALVLIGVAVGFVLLRIEAAIEESE